MSGKKTKTKRKTEAKKTVAKTMQTTAAGTPPKLELETPAITLKLDLAAGQSPREGFEGVDIWPEAKHVVNLLRFPWPWADNSVAEIHSSHFLEHIPMEFVDEHGNYVPCGTPGAQDLLFKFMDECWRILIPEGRVTIIVPCARNNRAFQDPTHRRFFVAETFMYFFKAMREANKLDHYNVKCNFGSVGEPGIPDVAPIILSEYNAWTPEVQQRRFHHEWNTIQDWQARLKAIK